MPLDGEYEPSPDKRAREQVELYESSGGTKGLTLRGKPVIILTTKGAKSGRLRKIPLMRVEHEGSYAVVASQGGAPKHPNWYFNLKADPDALMVQDGADLFDATARELEGEERETWWNRAVAAYPNYAVYQTRTDRLIPVLLAERRS